MSNNNQEPEERRKVILDGINSDLNSQEIATQLGVNMRVVIRDLRAMKYNRDPALKQAYLEQEARLVAGRLVLTNVKDDKFRRMTGMSFQEKSFENMVDYYTPELTKILESKDQYVAIMNLSKSVQRTMTHNEIIAGRKYRRQISPKARVYLSQGRYLPSK
jgi:hypothetical protein